MTEDTDPVAATVDMMTLKSQPNTLKKKPGVIGEAAKERPKQEATAKAAAAAAIATATSLPTSPAPEQKQTEPKQTEEALAIPKQPEPSSSSPGELATENAALREQISRLQHDLHEAQDLIFSLQPLQQPLTETEAVSEFQALIASVEEWVDQKLGDALEPDNDVSNDTETRDETNTEGSHSEGGGGNLVFQVDPQSTPRVMKEIQSLLDLIPSPGRAAFAYHATDVDVVQALIMRYLSDAIFSQDFYCPLPKAERELVTVVERSMRTLTPRRDTRSRRHWRVETYTALSARPGFDQYATNRMWDLTYDITRLLRLFASEGDGQKLAKSFFEGITKPASELARKMHLSFDEFAVEWSGYHDRVGECERLFQDGPLEGGTEFEFVELQSRKTLREMPGKDARWMFDLTPRLVVRKLKADAYAEARTLVKPRILISNRLKEKNGALTVLGTLERWLQEQYYTQARQRESRSGSRILSYLSGM
ncbi:hypothetical protein ASPCAL06778 [Aspergillus calidoustus]|uniref:Uncharacterized protein n=1 Tax=Aspergillus calidoustus TaxID=454130 RepID=A0A0U5G419_ASPCI|nr:hypothetical protein ASPCAL06778 [Aspergillus calidoustus]